MTRSIGSSNYCLIKFNKELSLAYFFQGVYNQKSIHSWILAFALPMNSVLNASTLLIVKIRENIKRKQNAKIRNKC